MLRGHHRHIRRHRAGKYHCQYRDSNASPCMHYRCHYGRPHGLVAVAVSASRHGRPYAPRMFPAFTVSYKHRRHFDIQRHVSSGRVSRAAVAIQFRVTEPGVISYCAFLPACYRHLSLVRSHSVRPDRFHTEETIRHDRRARLLLAWLPATGLSLVDCDSYLCYLRRRFYAAISGHESAELLATETYPSNFAVTTTGTLITQGFWRHLLPLFGE